MRVDTDVTLRSDDALAARVRAGDEEAFAALSERHRAWLIRLCTRTLGDPHLAEDIAQETLVKAYRQFGKGEAPDRLRPWLKVVARNACIDERRRRSPEYLGALAESSAGLRPTQDELTNVVDIVADDLDPPLATAWAHLGERHREVLREREIRGLSYAEIAVAMGLSVAAVETLLFRARAALRREYTRAGGTPVAPDSLVRSLALIDAGRVHSATPVVRTLGTEAARMAADAAPALGQAANAGALDGWRELAAGVAATALALGLLGSPRSDSGAHDPPAPKTDAVAVPAVPGTPTVRTPTAPEPDVPDAGMSPPAASPPAAEPPSEPGSADAGEETGRIRRILDSPRRIGDVTLEYVDSASGRLEEKVLD